MRHDHLTQSERTSQPPAKTNNTPSPERDPHALLALQNDLGNEATRHLLESGQLQLASGVLQAKLTVGEPDDAYEQEADAVADQVMTMPEPLQREEMPLEEDEEMLQQKAIQREEMPLEEDEEMLQGKSDGGVPEVTDSIEQQIDQMRGGGQAMPSDTRDFLEPRFGQDFSNVNIHTGNDADALNQQLQAKAFTVGNDIFFRSGEYNPDSNSGRTLMAHELTHVVQQGASKPRRQADDETDS